MSIAPTIPPAVLDLIEMKLPRADFLLLTRYVLDSIEPTDWPKYALDQLDVIFGAMDDAAVKLDVIYDSASWEMSK